MKTARGIHATEDEAPREDPTPKLSGFRTAVRPPLSVTDVPRRPPSDSTPTLQALPPLLDEHARATLAAVDEARNDDTEGFPTRKLPVVVPPPPRTPTMTTPYPDVRRHPRSQAIPWQPAKFPLSPRPTSTIDQLIALRAPWQFLIGGAFCVAKLALDLLLLDVVRRGLHLH
jgi:hypothetical protein